MIVNVIELLFVLACLQSSEEFTFNQSEQLEDEWYKVNYNNSCVEEDQIETEEDPGNYTEADKEMEFHETLINRPSWRGCEQRQNETEKPRNSGRILSRSKREETSQHQEQLLTCEKCRILERKGKEIECETICGKICRECEKARISSGKPNDCGKYCGEWIPPCHQCRRKEKEKKFVDCELSCGKSCHDCLQRSRGMEHECNTVCGNPRLPCEQCWEKLNNGENVNCEWTCEASCVWCNKMKTRLDEEFPCEKYCGKSQPCYNCRKHLHRGNPYDCAEKCERPCLTCREAQKSGRYVNCTAVCESSCFGCRYDKNATADSEECRKFCIDQLATSDKDSVLQSCDECRLREKNGAEVDCEFVCETECNECLEKGGKDCVKKCGTPPHPCKTCWAKLKEKTVKDCEGICASSCITCEDVSKKSPVQGGCGRFCGVPPMPCWTCRQKNTTETSDACSQTCEIPCKECRKTAKTTLKIKQCDVLCGISKPLSTGPGNGTAKLVDCVSCNGIVDLGCNIPYEHDEKFNKKCEKECVLIELQSKDSGSDDNEPTDHYIMRGCADIRQQVPEGYNIRLERTCTGPVCNTNDELFLSPTQDHLRANPEKQPSSSSETRRMWIHLTWLLFMYHSVF